MTDHTPRSSLLVLAAIFAAFLVARVPVMLRQPGGLDEEYYAIPGLTILEGGIPRLPHVPQRDPRRVFYLADQALFAEPPLSFYWQALFYALLPDTYGTGRLASGAAALAVLWLVYELARTFYQSAAAGLWAAGMCSLMRSFYFPLITARPDMLCTAFALAALLCVARWRDRQSPNWLWPAGVFLGLGGLTHPVAMIAAVQSAAWLCLASRGWRRALLPVLLAAVALAVFALWLPLIARHPDAFRNQFLGNILRPTGPGLAARLVCPWAALTSHAEMMFGHLGPIQSTLLLGGVTLATIAAWVGRPVRPRGPAMAPLLAWSSVYLLAALVGVHPTQYLWCFPTTLLCVCLGGMIAAASARLRSAPGGRFLRTGGGVLLVALLLPGAGLRTCFAHLRHWNDVNYNAPAFARRMLEDLPANARFTVDREFVLDFYATGRRTLLAETFPVYFRAEEFPYDYLVISRHGLDEELAATMNGELVRVYGDRDDLFACYAEVYRPAHSGDTDR